MTDDLTSSHLGHALKPRDIPSTGFEQWCLTVSLPGGLVPVAFSREQALEIARRIVAHYGEPMSAETAEHWRLYRESA